MKNAFTLNTNVILAYLEQQTANNTYCGGHYKENEVVTAIAIVMESINANNVIFAGDHAAMMDELDSDSDLWLERCQSADSPTCANIFYLASNLMADLVSAF